MQFVAYFVNVKWVTLFLDTFIKNLKYFIELLGLKVQSKQQSVRVWSAMGGGGQQTDRITGTNGRFSTYTWEEVQKHTKSGDQWIVVERKVYNVSQWVKRHPGGLRILGHYAGEDASVKHLASIHLQHQYIYSTFNIEEL